MNKVRSSRHKLNGTNHLNYNPSVTKSANADHPEANDDFVLSPTAKLKVVMEETF